MKRKHFTESMFLFKKREAVKEEKKMKLWILVLGMTLVVGALIMISAPREVSAVAPCCEVTAIDMKTGIVTAENFTTKETFEFKLGNETQLKNIKIGDKVSADTLNGTITVHGDVESVDGTLLKGPVRPTPPK